MNVCIYIIEEFNNVTTVYLRKKVIRSGGIRLDLKSHSLDAGKSFKNQLRHSTLRLKEKKRIGFIR